MSPELRGDWQAVTVLHPGAGQTALGQPEIKMRTGGSRGLVTGRAPGTGHGLARACNPRPEGRARVLTEAVNLREAGAVLSQEMHLNSF